jgi:hypothetical protein
MGQRLAVSIGREEGLSAMPAPRKLDTVFGQEFLDLEINRADDLTAT